MFMVCSVSTKTQNKFQLTIKLSFGVDIIKLCAKYSHFGYYFSLALILYIT